MIQARTFSTLLALGALTALPGCSYLGMNGGGGGHQYSQATPNTQYSSPAASQETAEAENTANNAPQSQISQPITTALVRKVQSQLKRDGLYHGNIDGMWGPRSQQAATQFQQQHNLNTTGEINLPMLQAMNLNLSNANQQYGQANTGGNAMGGNGQGGLNRATPNQQYGRANTGPNGTMAPNGTVNGNTGPNAGTGQYGQANTGYGQANTGQNGSMAPNANGPNTMQTGANGTYTTGGQNTAGTSQATNNTPYNNNGPNPNQNPANNPAPATGTGTTH